MALTTIAEIKATWLNVESTEHDTRLTALLAQATSRINQICRQPVDGSSTTYDFTGLGCGTLFQLPYTVPIVLTATGVKEELTDSAFTTITDVSVIKRDRIWQAFREDGFSEYAHVRLTLTIGYDGVTYTVPSDIANIACEMVANEFRLTDFAGGGSRLGVDSIGRSEGGTGTTTRYKMMDDVWVKRLRHYTTLEY